MADDKKFDLSRRKVLGSIGTIGVASAAAGAGTMAWFNDTESSSGNKIKAGVLDLQLDWTETYNGNKVSTQGRASDVGAIFKNELQDVKPGDSGEATISVHAVGNPAWVWMGGAVTTDSEGPNSINEPEADAGDTTMGDGELAEEIEVTVWQEEDGDNSQASSGEPTIAEGSLKDVVNNQLGGGILLDGDLSTSSTDDTFPSDTDRYVGFSWELPSDTGNMPQGDVVEFNLMFGAVQGRHISDPSGHNPL